MKKWKILLLTFLIGGLLLLGVSSFAETKPVKDISIFYIVKASNSFYWQIVMNGAQLAAKDLGVKITFQEPLAESDVAKQVSILNDAIALHPDAIIIAPTVADALVPGIEQAMNQGIKVILIDSAANTQDYVSFLSTNNVQAGKDLAKEFVDLIVAKYGKAEGNIAYMTSMAGVGSLSQRDQGFLEGLKEYGPNLKIVAHQYANNAIDTATTNWENIFTANPNLVGVFADNNVTGDGLARALQLSGMAGKLVAVAFDNDPAEIDALSNGILQALQIQQPWIMGYWSVFYAVSAVEGVGLPKNVDTGAFIATKANMNTPEGQAILNPIEFHKNWK